MLTWLERDDPFPPVEKALRNPNGLLCAGADLSVPRLLAAYRNGIFPWYSGDEPILWWSPDPRMVLSCDELKISHSLAKNLRNKGFETRIDSAFAKVIKACAEPRKEGAGTWISAEMQAAYVALHRAGHAHSVETWVDGTLVGGLYGVAIGRAFFGESMFATMTDASKIAFVHLVRQLERWQFGLIDCQMKTSHLASLGAREISRATFVAEIARLTEQQGAPGRWHFE